MQFQTLINIVLLLVVVKINLIFAWYLTGFDSTMPGEYSYQGAHDGSEQTKRFTNEWTVHVEGGEEVAQLVALELGYVYEGPVRWAEQLFEKKRVKRYTMPDLDKEVHRVKRVENFNSSSSEIARVKKFIEVSGAPAFNDELWDHEWYLQDTRTVNHLPRLDLNVLPAYAMGFNGAGVRVSVLDDGIEHNHTDLRDNYDPEISWDSNSHDPDPTPRYEDHMTNSHGTRCAGEIAMTANNFKCGVGVAWGAKVGGVRMLDGRITDRVEGEAIGYASDKVDIYSASWGPNDDGRTVEGPGRLAMAAFTRGITEGREGKGTIYVWANGNGGGSQDNCNCDGYSSSIYTISIGSASQHGLFPWYGETCSSTLAAAYSSGAYKDQKIATTDTGDSCTLSHTGTSAAAPLAAGIIALVLQANPNLTWRDVQHLIVWTSEYAPLSHNPGWQTNGVGLRFDVRFGFGLLNAGALVSTALNWTTVPPKSVCHVEVTPLTKEESYLSTKDPVDIFIKVVDCSINYIEHVEYVVNIEYSRRGALQVYLQSPQGTRVQLLSPRPRDKSQSGFVNWPLMSVAMWGENPNGFWRVTIEDKTDEHNTGFIGPFKLIIHGTVDMPRHMKNGPRKYNDEYNYQRAFKYFDSLNDVDLASGDNHNVTTTVADMQHAEDIMLSNIDPGILNQVEEQLQRMHHRENLLKSDDVFVNPYVPT